MTHGQRGFPDQFAVRSVPNTEVAAFAHGQESPAIRREQNLEEVRIGKIQCAQRGSGKGVAQGDRIVVTSDGEHPAVRGESGQLGPTAQAGQCLAGPGQGVEVERDLPTILASEHDHMAVRRDDRRHQRIRVEGDGLERQPAVQAPPLQVMHRVQGRDDAGIGQRGDGDQRFGEIGAQEFGFVARQIPDCERAVGGSGKELAAIRAQRQRGHFLGVRQPPAGDRSQRRRFLQIDERPRAGLDGRGSVWGWINARDQWWLVG